MSTAISMPSPHHTGASAFATSLQLSPAFRSIHAAALRQRQSEIERLRELARSDEFSDDESDGEDDDEDDDDVDSEAQEEEEEEEEDAEEQAERRDVVHAEPLAEAAPQMSPRDASDSDVDRDDTVLLPFVRPTVVHRPGQDLVSPRADDWTIVDKSPTCEGLVYGNVNVSESWFGKP